MRLTIVVNMETLASSLPDVYVTVGGGQPNGAVYVPLIQVTKWGKRRRNPCSSRSQMTIISCVPTQKRSIPPLDFDLLLGVYFFCFVTSLSSSSGSTASSGCIVCGCHTVSPILCNHQMSHVHFETLVFFFLSFL